MRTALLLSSIDLAMSHASPKCIKLKTCLGLRLGALCLFCDHRLISADQYGGCHCDHVCQLGILSSDLSSYSITNIYWSGTCLGDWDCCRTAAGQAHQCTSPQPHFCIAMHKWQGQSDKQQALVGQHACCLGS